MKFAFVTFLLFVGAIAAHAELQQIDVFGSASPADKPYSSNQKGFSLHLIQTKKKDGLVLGLLTVPDAFGPIEAAVLSLIDSKGVKIGRIVLGAQILDKGSRDFEFDLERSLLKNSVIQISNREGDDFHIAKVSLASFRIQNEAEQDAAANP